LSQGMAETTTRQLTSPGSCYDAVPSVVLPPTNRVPRLESRFHCLDFFAGSGLVSEALRPYFKTIWANDICPKKAQVFRANHPNTRLHLGSIEDVRGTDLPSAALSWGSFPCQDLSLAGNAAGIGSARSGLVWQWVRVMDEMPTSPPVVVAENVTGLISTRSGDNYVALHNALVARGYRVGAVVLDSAPWLPQSRKRVFVIGVQRSLDSLNHAVGGPTWCHPQSLVRLAEKLDYWSWWALPEPVANRPPLESLIDWTAPCDNDEQRSRNLALVSERHRRLLDQAISNGERVFPGYKRRRNGIQVLELRFDGIAGCLRTPEGGSSRQLLVLWKDGSYCTRLLTVREAARLMGAPEEYQIPGSYNDGYRAMGDAVALPVVRFLARNLLAPLVTKALEVATCL
jgi:DNA (cytosine-5)-methyltransferase 1